MFIHHDQCDARWFAWQLFDQIARDTLGAQPGQGFSAKVIIADGCDQGYGIRSCARGGHSLIGSLATRRAKERATDNRLAGSRQSSSLDNQVGIDRSENEDGSLRHYDGFRRVSNERNAVDATNRASGFYRSIERNAMRQRRRTVGVSPPVFYNIRLPTAGKPAGSHPPFSEVEVAAIFPSRTC
jgi:hypothetical protein